MDKLQVRQDTIKSIQEAVASCSALSTEDLKRESTRREVTVPRQIAIYLAKQMTDASLPEIGRQFDAKHPTAVNHLPFLADRDHLTIAGRVAVPSSPISAVIALACCEHRTGTELSLGPPL
jgi:Bacterial dnaA protein helix-turn-helix